MLVGLLAILLPVIIIFAAWFLLDRWYGKKKKKEQLENLKKERENDLADSVEDFDTGGDRDIGGGD